MSNCKHNHNHDSCPISCNASSVHQTLEELDFERGIWCAAQSGDLEKVSKLVHGGQDVNSKDGAEYTALHYAARCGYLDICKFLLDRRADVDAVTKAGCATALHRACTAGKIEIVKLLLRNNANVTLKDNDGKTALHRAAEAQNKEICEYLIAACPKLKDECDNKNKLPMDFAKTATLASILKN